MTGDTTKFVGKVTRQLFPKDGVPAKSGDFAIIVIKPIKILEVKEQIIYRNGRYI